MVKEKRDGGRGADVKSYLLLACLKVAHSLIWTVHATWLFGIECMPMGRWWVWV